MNKNAFKNISYGLYVLSSWDDMRPTGCTINSVMQITSEPATVAVSVNHNNFTNQCIEKSGRFAISILSVNSKPSIIGTFGFKSGKDVNKFESIKHNVLDEMPVLEDCCAYIICEVINKMETESHTVFLGKVLNADVVSEEEPMTYSYYHKVIKGKSPKNAPTYIAQEDKDNSKIEKYVCSVCGYVYDGEIPFENLTDDYKCPVCGEPKSAFDKQE